MKKRMAAFFCSMLFNYGLRRLSGKHVALGMWQGLRPICALALIFPELIGILDHGNHTPKYRERK